MTTTPSAPRSQTLPLRANDERHACPIRAIAIDELAQVSGGGIASQFGSMFGAEGAKWGGIADQLIGMFGGA